MIDCAILSQVDCGLACLAVMQAVLDHPIGLLTVMSCLTIQHLLSALCQAASFLVVNACSAQYACSGALTDQHGMLVCNTCVSAWDPTVTI